MSQRCLDYWDEKGLARPSVQAASGKGTLRRYSFQDLLRLAVVKRLRESGLPLQRIQKGLNALKKRSPKRDPLLEEVLVTDGRTLFRECHNHELEDLLARGQMVFSVVATGKLRGKLREETLKIDELRKRSMEGRRGSTRRKRSAV